MKQKGRPLQRFDIDRAIDRIVSELRKSNGLAGIPYRLDYDYDLGTDTFIVGGWRVNGEMVAQVAHELRAGASPLYRARSWLRRTVRWHVVSGPNGRR